MILTILPPSAQHANGARILGVAGGHRATLAVGPKIFARIETKARYLPDAADGASFVFCSVRLSGIFDYNQAAPSRYFHDRVHVGGLTVEMHGQDRLRARCDRSLDRSRIHRE